jgi:hypothetical protein
MKRRIRIDLQISEVKLAPCSKVSGIDFSHCFYLCRLLSESQNIENMSFLPISANIDRFMRFFAAQ